MSDERHPHEVRRAFRDGRLPKAPHNLLAHLLAVDEEAIRLLAETDWEALGPHAAGLRHFLTWCRWRLAEAEGWAVDVIPLPD